MLAAQLTFVLILLLVCCFAPGFFLVRRFAWDPLEKLCASIGLSLILVYLACWAIYLLPPAGQTASYFAVSAGCAMLAAIARRDLAAFFAITPPHRAPQ